MMRIAILTFQDAKNYGAMLQAFALKKVVSKFANADIINYYNPYFHKNVSLKNVKSLIKYMVNFKTNHKKNNRFLTFLNAYLVDNSPYIYKDKLYTISKNYDIYIVGSDQVWNLSCSGNDRAYFLDFVETEKKISYAASFGSDTIENIEEISCYLRQFHRISVREKSAKFIIEDLISSSIVSVVLDPTFLISKEQWANEFNLTFRKEYVLVYEVLVGDKLFNSAIEFARQSNLKVICITNTDRLRMGAKVIKDAGPKEWLSLFAGAAYVFTNSFHGLAFSINFEKQFYIELLPPPSTTNARIIELMEKFNLTNRFISNMNENNIIDFSKLKKELEVERIKSISFIKEAISEKDMI